MRCVVLVAVPVADRVLIGAWDPTLWTYFGAAGLLCLSALLLFIAAQALLMGADIYLTQHWATESAAEQQDRGHLVIYGALSGAAAVVALTRSCCFYLATLRAASGLHNKALARVRR